MPATDLQTRFLIMLSMTIASGIYIMYRRVRKMKSRLRELEQLLSERNDKGEPRENQFPDIKVLKPLEKFIYSNHKLVAPVMSGMQLLDQLKTRVTFSGMSVIALNSGPGFGNKFQTLRTEYFLRSFTETRLLTRTTSLLASYRRQPELPQTFQLPLTTNVQNHEAAETEKPALSPENQAWLQMLETLVRDNITCDTLNVEWIAMQVFLSERQLYRRLKMLTGLTVNEYIREMRLQEARHLLENRLVDTVKKAALTVCFKDLKYFTQIFRARFGKNPSEVLAA